MNFIQLIKPQCCLKFWARIIRPDFGLSPKFQLITVRCSFFVLLWAKPKPLSLSPRWVHFAPFEWLIGSWRCWHVTTFWVVQKFSSKIFRFEVVAVNSSCNLKLSTQKVSSLHQLHAMVSPRSAAGQGWQSWQVLSIRQNCFSFRAFVILATLRNQWSRNFDLSQLVFKFCRWSASFWTKREKSWSFMKAPCIWRMPIWPEISSSSQFTEARIFGIFGLCLQG